jgi:homocysteine S-methyltransferase
MSPAEFTRRSWMADGAMATYLCLKSPLGTRPVEELNLTQPELVGDVHREYLDAGAQILRTNTFGGRLESKPAGVRIAREAARGRALVAGVVGSVGGGGTREWFRRCAEALEGVDLFVLETFTSMEELRAAVEGVRDAAGDGIALIAQVSVERDGSLRDGSSPEVYGRALHALAADVVGFNCSFGPESVAAAFERVRQVTDKPMSAVPNAGFETLFPPAYMAEHAGRFLRRGALVVGTCCGSTPEHIRAIADEHATLGSQWPRT